VGKSRDSHKSHKGVTEVTEWSHHGHITHSHKSRSQHVTKKSGMRTVGGKVHSHNSNCIYSVAESNRDSIEFSLSITEQRAVGFIPAWSLASLHREAPVSSQCSRVRVLS